MGVTKLNNSFYYNKWIKFQAAYKSLLPIMTRSGQEIAQCQESWEAKMQEARIDFSIAKEEKWKLNEIN